MLWLSSKWIFLVAAEAMNNPKSFSWLVKTWRIGCSVLLEIMLSRSALKARADTDQTEKFDLISSIPTKWISFTWKMVSHRKGKFTGMLVTTGKSSLVLESNWDFPSKVSSSQVPVAFEYENETLELLEGYWQSSAWKRKREFDIEIKRLDAMTL